MILAVDIGNSNICIGGLDGMKVLFRAHGHPPALHRG